jgi:hypothetical protein
MNKRLNNMLHARIMLVACGAEFNNEGVWRRVLLHLRMPAMGRISWLDFFFIFWSFLK